MLQKDLLKKYRHYYSQGHLVLAVTLSTYIQSESYASSDRMRHLWDQHFIRRVKRRLPVNVPLDHDWILERSPEGYFHYHGFLAVSAKYSDRLWKNNQLNKHLTRDLKSFTEAGKYRPFRINKFLIEPVHNIADWTTYITKDTSMNSTYNLHHESTPLRSHNMNDQRSQLMTINALRPQSLHTNSPRPHFAGLKKVDRNLIDYLSNCLATGRDPELLISATVDRRKHHLSLELAVPEKEEAQEETANTGDIHSGGSGSSDRFSSLISG